MKIRKSGLLSALLTAAIALSFSTATAGAESAAVYQQPAVSYKLATKISLSQATIRLAAKVLSYDGTARRPAVTVTYGGTKLVKGTDYTLTFGNNVVPGTAHVTVTGKGKYSGTRTTYFTIKGVIPVTDLTATVSPKTFVYDGTEREPSVTLKYGSKRLVEGVDYDISYRNNVNVGTAAVYIEGLGYYTGKAHVNFKITNPPVVPTVTNISGATITLSGTQFTYDGFAKEPVITAVYGGKLLTKNIDYVVGYTNNINPGSATATITGIGNYTGSVNKSFVITNPAQKNIATLASVLSSTSYTYDGYAKTPTVTVYDGYNILRQNFDYTLAYSNNIAAGTASVKITGIGAYNGITYQYFTIAQPANKNIATLRPSLTQTTFTYDGYAKMPGVSIYDGYTALRQGYDYFVSYINNVNAGTATVYITGTGNYSGSAQLNFTITAPALKNIAALSATVSGGTTYTATGGQITPGVQIFDAAKLLTQNVDYVLTYTSNVNPGTATVRVTGIGSYTGTKSLNFTIIAQPSPGPGTSIAHFQIFVSGDNNANNGILDGSAKYNGSTYEPYIFVKNASGVYLAQGKEYTILYSHSGDTHTAIVTCISSYSGTRYVQYLYVV